MKPTDLHSSLTLGRVRAAFSYDPETGVFTWRHQPGKGHRRAGSTAGHLHASTGYVTIWLDGASYLAHRLAWFYVHGFWPALYLDHINGDQADNRLCNLREATQSQNMANQHRQRTTNRSGYRGVSFNRDAGKWRAVVHVSRKQISLGYFNTPEAAKTAYDIAIRQHFGEYANTSI